MLLIKPTPVFTYVPQESNKIKYQKEIFTYFKKQK